jgi:hypothetical protein
MISLISLLILSTRLMLSHQVSAFDPKFLKLGLEKPNDFELIFSETLSVNQRRSFGTSHYPVAELAQQVGHKAAR